MGSIQFRNWNSWAIPIPKMELLILKKGIGIDKSEIGIEVC